MRPDSITLAIFEKYSAEEMTTTAQQLVQALNDKETAETEKKMSDSVFKERINKHEAEANDLAKRYSKGGETAQIGCDIRYDDPEPGKKSYYRMDRAELVETHDMSWEERQETIQFPLTAQPTDEQVNDAIAGLDTKANDLSNPPKPEIATDNEVTRICPYPGCIHFADHEGEHEVPQNVEATDSEIEPEPKKRGRKPKLTPPPEPPCQEPPQPGAGTD